jgi:hypothetical protein
MLKKFGDVNIESITDNLNPHSASHVPDLVFVPETGPNKNIVHIVEFKPTSSDILPSVLVFNARQYKRRIQAANPDIEFRYALSSNGQVIVDDSEREEVTPLATIHDAQELVDKIVNWSGVEEQEQETTTVEATASLTEPYAAQSSPEDKG